MLTILQIKEICEEGISLSFKRKSHPEGLKGEWDPESLQAAVYLPEQESEQELELTILHELIHARDHLRDKSLDEKMDEDKVEYEARRTYQRTPEVLDLIRQLYRVPRWKESYIMER